MRARVTIPDSDGHSPVSPRLSLRVLVRVVIGVLAGLLLVISAASVAVSIRVGDAQSQLRDHLIPAQTAADQLAEAYVDEETGQRGYLLTGHPIFLQPYHSGRTQAAALQVELRTRLAKDPQARRLLAQVAAAESRWRVEAAQPEITARGRGPIPAAVLLPLAQNGRRLFDALRVRLARLQTRTTALTTSQLDRISAAQLVSNVVIAIAVVLALLVTGLSLILLRRHVDRPVGRLVAEVKAVAGGAYDHPISTSGPTEVTDLARAVASMRASITHNSETLVRAQHQLTLTQERERISADLRDMTIQRVFGLGLALTSTAARRTELSKDLQPLIDQSDEIIREVRRVVYEIKNLPRQSGVEAQLTRALLESEQILGFAPGLELAGPVDEVTTADVLVELAAAVREALSNVARHAQATTATVRIAVEDGELHLAVSDDGVGVPADAESGPDLMNLRERAARLGGTASIGPNTTLRGGRRGTQVDWRVPTIRGRDGPEPEPLGRRD